MPFGRMFGGFNAPPMNRPQAPMNRPQAPMNQMPMQQPPFGSGMPPNMPPGNPMQMGIGALQSMQGQPMQQPQMGGGLVQTGEFGSQPVMMPASGFAGPNPYPQAQAYGQQQMDQMAQNAYPPMASPGAGPNPQMGMLSNLNQMFSMAQQNPMQGGSPLQNNSSPLQSGGTPLQQSQKFMGNPGLF